MAAAARAPARHRHQAPEAQLQRARGTMPLARGLFTLGSHNMSYAHRDDEITTLISVYGEVFPLLADAVRRGDVESRLCCEPLQPLFRVR